MTPEEKEILKRTLKLTEDNNDILHSMRRSMRLQRLMSIVYWVFIVGGALGAYYLIQPYVDQLRDLYNSASGVISGL